MPACGSTPTFSTEAKGDIKFDELHHFCVLRLFLVTSCTNLLLYLAKLTKIAMQNLFQGYRTAIKPSICCFIYRSDNAVRDEVERNFCIKRGWRLGRFLSDSKTSIASTGGSLVELCEGHKRHIFVDFSILTSIRVRKFDEANKNLNLTRGVVYRMHETKE